MSQPKVLTPEVLWAQRSSESIPEENYLLVTIAVPDCEEPEVKVSEKTLDFSAVSKGHVGDEQPHHYKLKINFYKDVDSSKTLKKIANGQHYFLKIFKKDLGIEYWPRLTEEKVKYSYIKTDFNKWVDEDEQNSVPEAAAAAGPDFNEMLMNGNPDMEMLKQQLAQGGGGMPDLSAAGLGEELGDYENEEEEEEEK
ncbi:hypothetical protein HG535_0D03160 [Zygotorulaspora mrakii]|uniref:CS domain-containing protein n=1 Tax=Zygotorulaspora mrakii TaxID=42260 RepID=A0A7H9B1T0_ZYGMR|nr:uncharacterized protein HG535_0D03160 [Zygotorulaspora mrakii]QLG72608.1 hypothetical protein HG535_0D03160 [Zygotorulaspora mrakii]